MSEQFLHGVEVVELSVGPRPVQTVKSSVIGIVGTAPDARGAEAAKVVIRQADCTFEVSAKTPGILGNNLHFKIESGEQSSLSVNANEIIFTLNFETEAVVKALELKTLLEKNAQASSLIAVEVIKDGVLVPTVKSVYLANGQDDPLPLNTPTLITSPSFLAQIGRQGSLYTGLTGIFDQTGAMVIAVRVEEGENEGETLSNIIGGVDDLTGQYTGIHALKAAETATGVKPRILITPRFSDELSVAKEIDIIAQSLKAVGIIDGPNLSDVHAVQMRAKFGSDRLFIVEPSVEIFEDGTTKRVPASPYVAGLIAKIDNEHGFWHSPSNHEISGITGLSRPIDFSLGDTNCAANYLNENDVATIIRKDGFRLWGNRTTSSDKRFAFLCVRRTADMINDSLQRAILWANDKPMSENFIDSIVESVNAYLRHLRSIGAIVNGEAFANLELNQPSDIEQGKLTIDFDFTPMYPAEHITLRSQITNQYLKEIV